MPGPRPTSVRGLRVAAATADHLATDAAMQVFSLGGNAVDAAIAANAAIAVTGPHLCGMGGDLFALVHTGRSVVALNASGRAGSGVDAEAMRRAGHAHVPLRHHAAAVTVPGCVDGWVTLHDRFGSVPLDRVLAPAIALAEGGFPASPLLVGSLATLDAAARPRFAELLEQADAPGAPVRRPGVARALRSIIEGGRGAFYGGAFGAGLVDVTDGTITREDLDIVQADWVDPLTLQVFGHELHTMPPNSQGYLLLAAAGIVERIGLPDDTDDPAWIRLLVEAAIAVGHDRPDRLHDRADGSSLVSDLLTRTDDVRAGRSWPGTAPSAAGDTTYLCTADDHGMSVSLIQSNASGFGSWLVEPDTGINLHDRGLGFSLVSGHPAELAPGRRPPHTLSPAMVTRSGDHVGTFGTMGGDAQPQILLQVLARLLGQRHGPARAIDAPRWVLQGPSTGFDTWATAEPTVVVEDHAPPAWFDAFSGRRELRRARAYDPMFGHAHAVVRDDRGGLAVWADPRARVGSAAAR